MPMMLQDLVDQLQQPGGMPPLPPPGAPPSALAAQLMGLGSIDQRHKLLQQQYDQGGQLAAGAPVDYSRGKGLPLALAGIANLVSAGLGGYQQGKATGGLRDLVTEQDAGRTAAARTLLNAPTPDLSSLLTASPADLPAKAQAAQSAVQGQRQSGLLAALTGDPQLAGAGKMLYGDADKAQDTMLSMPQQRQQLAGGALDLAGKQRGADVATSPVVGNAGAALLKKMGFAVPGGASPAEIAALVPEAQKQYAEDTKRMEVGKFGTNPITGRLYNTRTGQDVPGSGGPGDPTTDKRFPKMQDDFKKDMDPNLSRSGTLKQNSERQQAAQRLLTLAVDPLTGGPANLTPQQMTEVSGALATLIGGGSSGEGTRHELTPYTGGRSLAELTQWLTNAPQGTGQQAFVKQMIDTARREQATAGQAVRQAQAQRLSSHLQYLQMFPEAAKAQMQSYGFDPADVDFKTGRYTQKAAVPQGAATKPGQRPRRTVGGETREWDGQKWVLP